ncbi:MAG: chromosome segregation protein SMC [Deltaproteobacteria bacterium]|nr:chromosome segregation protein SMC [Deltaproteobacteria bacterium]
MRLRSIEIHGFKSFYDRINFSFPSGITTIVGPNGCGKSNILDAILWAMGERSAKHLRGKVMEDVIFAGSDGTKPLGMAEVNLVLANDDGGCPDRYKQFDEIMISRRLFRSGESEFFINKRPCRLRDVVDLFLDLGISNQAYSIVEQGKVEAIIHAKPEERRILIEEAAGIAKFRDRKREALSKIEQTEQNLLRIQDVLGEIRRQIQSLEKQVKKAERFKSLRKEIRRCEIALAYGEYSRLRGEQAENEKILAQLKRDEDSLSERLQERENTLRALRTERAQWEERIASIERTIYETRGAIEREEERIEAGQREVASLKNLEVQYGGEIDELNTRLQDAANQRAALLEESSDLGRMVNEKEKELEARRAEWQAFRDGWSQAGRYLEDQKADLVELLSQQSKTANQIAFCERNLKELNARKDQNDREIAEASGQVKSNASLRLEKEALQGSLRAKQARCEGEVKTLEGEVALLEKESGETELRMSRIDREYQIAWSKLRSLEELQRGLEGFDEGVKALMLARETEATGIRGLVADIVETEPSYEAAVSAVLAHRLQYVIVESHEEGLKAVDLLKREARGRIGVIPMNLKAERFDSRDSLARTRGVVGPLLDHVRLKPGYEHIGRLLLGNVWLVESLDEAMRVWHEGRSFQALVTPGGEVFDGSGIIIGGSHDGRSLQILERKAGIRSLTGQVAQKRSHLDQARARLQVIRQRLSEARSRLEKKDKERQGLALELVAAEREMERLIQEGEEREKRHRVLVFERDQLKSRISELEEEISRARQEFQKLEQDLETRRETIQRAKLRLEESEKEKERMDREMTGLQVQIARWREQYRGAQRSLDSLEERERDLRRQVSKRLEMLEENGKILQKTEQDIARMRADLKEWKKKQEEAKDLLTLEKQGLKEKSKGARDLEDASRRDQIRLEDLKRRIHEQNLSLAETHLKMNHIFESILEKYRIDIRVAPVPEEVRNGNVPDQNRLASLKASLDGLGEVNLVALQEYEDLKERYEFLAGQQEDLRASLGRLRKAIQRIDRTTKRRFIEAFEGTNEKFQVLFPRLFNGGKAALVMTDEQDVLSTGIEIMVQLPGKRLQRLDLLSGGEKTLVAIALVFSLFLYRPTPFCLLDEVDAPLDDTNVGKFLEMIQELSGRSQLIVITHNKKTMEIAHTLYGITMESPGISKVVSVRLNQPELPSRAPN